MRRFSPSVFPSTTGPKPAVVSIFSFPSQRVLFLNLLFRFVAMADRVGVAIEGETEGETEGRGLFRGTRRRIPTWWCDDVYWVFFCFYRVFFFWVYIFIFVGLTLFGSHSELDTVAKNKGRGSS